MKIDLKSKLKFNRKEYFDFELRTVSVYTLFAILMGYFSFLMNHTAYAAVSAIIVVIVLTLILKKIFKIKENIKWWLGNGIILYLFVWIIVWTILYNSVVL